MEQKIPVLNLQETKLGGTSVLEDRIISKAALRNWSSGQGRRGVLFSKQHLLLKNNQLQKLENSRV